MFTISEKYRNNQYMGWQNLVPSTVLETIMSAFQTVVGLYNWEALCVFDYFIIFLGGIREGGTDKKEVVAVAKNNEDII